MRRAGLVLIAGVAAALGLAPSASAFDCSDRLDSFNRADSLTLGPSWTEQAPNIGIENLQATNPNQTTALATFNGRKAPQACADVATSLITFQYVAIVLGYKDLDHNLFIKVQDSNADGSFETVFWYEGNNGSPFATETTLVPFSSARMHVAWFGHSVTLHIDTDFDNRPDQTVGVVSGLPSGLGRKIGLGIYNDALADRFATARPPNTKIKKAKIKKAKHKAKFKFSSNQPDVRFRCKLDRKHYRRCDSPKVYKHLEDGKHKFRVKARDRFGNVDKTPAKKRFTI